VRDPNPAPSIFKHAAPSGSSDPAWENETNANKGLRKWIRRHEALGEICSAERDGHHFRLEFTSGREFEHAYRQHLSKNRFFLAGDHGLAPGDTVKLELALPGFDVVGAEAVVVYTVSTELARAYRRPGAGLSITGATSGYADTLRDYLVRTQLRPYATVLVAGEEARNLLANSGYVLEPAPDERRMVAILESDVVIAGVVATEDRYGEFVGHSTREPGNLVSVVRGPEDLHEVLAKLDSRTLQLATELEE
jgi:hypothetical protein